MTGNFRKWFAVHHHQVFTPVPIFTWCYLVSVNINDVLCVRQMSGAICFQLYSHLFSLYLLLPAINAVLCMRQMSGSVGLLYVVTKYSHLYLCDMETATCLCYVTLSSHVVFTTAVNSRTGGLLCINTAGQVRHIIIIIINYDYQLLLH